MDRSSRRFGFVRALVASSFLLLPACSDVSTSDQNGQARNSEPIISPAGVTSAGSIGPRSPVVPSLHLFPLPPGMHFLRDRSLPELDNQATRPAEQGDGAPSPPAVPGSHLFPSPPGMHFLRGRSLPELDHQAAGRAEQGDLPADELSIEGPVRADADQGVTIRRLPSVHQRVASSAQVPNANYQPHRPRTFSPAPVKNPESRMPSLELPALESRELESRELETPELESRERVNEGAAEGPQSADLSTGRWYYPVKTRHEFSNEQGAGPIDWSIRRRSPAVAVERPRAAAPASRPAPNRWAPVPVPVASMDPSRPTVEADRDATFAVITHRVMSLSRSAETLASRGAYYAARAEMVKAIRTITQALDTQERGKRHSESLACAMRAFQEAGDFAPRGSRVEGELNLAQIVSGHRTGVLKDINIDHLTSLTAQQKYLEYAQSQFADACGDLPAGSFALYGLARIYTVMEHAKVDTQTLCLPKAIALHQSALLIDSTNARAANELGVLLAQLGQLKDARRVLQHALSIYPEPEIWMNVAVVHQRLGDLEMARQAHQQGTLMASRQVVGARRDGRGTIRWVDPKTFSETRPGPGQ